MKLIYLYIQSYRGFKEAEFNFSRQIRIHYDKETRTLTKKELPGLPEKFWGENITDLTMIVGTNGAGKTSLMQYVIKLFETMLEKEAAGSETEDIMVLEEGDKLYYFVSGGDGAPIHEGSAWKNEREECRIEAGKRFYRVGRHYAAEIL